MVSQYDLRTNVFYYFFHRFYRDVKKKGLGEIKSLYTNPSYCQVAYIDHGHLIMSYLIKYSLEGNMYGSLSMPI